MTIQVNKDGPLVNTYRSTDWTAKVNTSDAYVYKASRALINYSPEWSAPGAVVTMNWFGFGTDETVSVELTKLSGTISSVDLYPHARGFSYGFTSTKITITLPPYAKAWMIVNGDWDNPVMVFADPLKDAIPALPTDSFVSKAANPVAQSGKVLYFGPGVWTIEELYPVQSGARIYLDAGAWVKGTFDLRNVSDVVIQGPGILSGERVLAETVQAMPTFEQQLENAMFYGGIPDAVAYGNHVRGITVVLAPFYGASGCINHWFGVKMLSPWVYNCDGIKSQPDSQLGYSTIQHNFIWVGDDGIDVQSNYTALVTDNVIVQVNGSAFLLLYFYSQDAGSLTIIARNYVASIGGFYGVDSLNTNCLIKAWVDAPDNLATYGRENVYIDELWVEGESTSRVPIFQFQNTLYPFPGVTPQDAAGDLASFVLRRVYVEHTPQRRSHLLGRDRNNTPRDMTFEKIWIEGVELSVLNWSTYVYQNEYPVRITVGGHPLATAVDICNLALSYLGDSAKITSITPPDGSAQAAACARFYTLSVNSVLEMAHWSFATRYVALVETVTNERTEWDYSYTLPADHLKAIAILPKDVDDDYGTKWVPLENPVYMPIVSSGSYNPKPFAIEQTSTGSIVLYTDQPEARLRYQAYVTNVNLFPPLFQMAVSWHLASMLAGPLIGGDQGAEQAKRCIQMMQTYLGKASVSDADQRQIKPDHVVSWMSNR